MLRMLSVECSGSQEWGGRRQFGIWARILGPFCADLIAGVGPDAWSYACRWIVLGPEIVPMVDRSFVVPFVHRLRFTEGVFDAGNGVLGELLEADERGPARVLICLD